MPILSVFFGIIVRMWHDDHPPPHIHVEYQGFEALVQIPTGQVSKHKNERGQKNRGQVLSFASRLTIGRGCGSACERF